MSITCQQEWWGLSSCFNIKWLWRTFHPCALYNKFVYFLFIKVWTSTAAPFGRGTLEDQLYLVSEITLFHTHNYLVLCHFEHELLTKISVVLLMNSTFNFNVTTSAELCCVQAKKQLCFDLVWGIDFEETFWWSSFLSITDNLCE